MYCSRELNLFYFKQKFKFINEAAFIKEYCGKQIIFSDVEVVTNAIYRSTLFFIHPILNIGLFLYLNI